jgi:carboxylesterase
VVATRLAAERPTDVSALALLSNALWLPNHITIALDLLTSVHAPDLWVPKPSSDLGDPEARRTHLSSAAQPLHAATSLLHGARETRAVLDRIACPVFIAHGARDRVCPSANAWRAALRLTATNPRVIVLPRSRHIITRDVERERLREQLVSFIADATSRTRQ